MSERALARVAWGLCGANLLLSLLLLFLIYLDGYGWDEFLAQVFIVVMAQSYPLLGAMIVARQPRGAIGWLFFVVCAFLLGALASEYARHAIMTDPGSLPGGVLAAWVGSWIFRPGFCALLLFLPLLFPTGRLVSPRWRPVAWFSVGLMVFFTLVGMFRPGLEDPLGKYVSNPFGIGRPGGLLDSIDAFGSPALFVTASVCFVSLALRFRRARSAERQQLKWLVYALVVMAACLVVIAASPGLPQWLGDVAFGILLASLPLATWVAIFRHRLYDIDLIINKTLVYTALTVTLAGAYSGAVVALGYIVQVLTGESSQLVLVASTLAMAALFQPLRRRIQSFIDRCFYRKKYDAAKTLETFSKKLRQETDLDTLSGDLTSVVRETMQPSHVSLWLGSPIQAAAEERERRAR